MKRKNGVLVTVRCDEYFPCAPGKVRKQWFYIHELVKSFGQWPYGQLRRGYPLAIIVNPWNGWYLIVEQRQENCLFLSLIGSRSFIWKWIRWKLFEKDRLLLVTRNHTQPTYIRSGSGAIIRNYRLDWSMLFKFIFLTSFFKSTLSHFIL